MGKDLVSLSTGCLRHRYTHWVSIQPVLFFKGLFVGGAIFIASTDQTVRVRIESWLGLLYVLNTWNLELRLQFPSHVFVCVDSDWGGYYKGLSILGKDSKCTEVLSRRLIRLHLRNRLQYKNRALLIVILMFWFMCIVAGIYYSWLCRRLPWRYLGRASRPIRRLITS